MVKENRILSYSALRAEIAGMSFVGLIHRSLSSMKILLRRRWMIFLLGILCAWILFSMSSKKALGGSVIPSSVSFSGESNVIYFLDRTNAKVYRYNIQGRLTRSYIVEELGKDLRLK